MSAELLRHLFSLLPACGLPPSWPACVRPCLSYRPGSQAQPAPSVGLRQPLPAPARSWQPQGLWAKHNPPAVDTVVDFQEGREGREGRGEAAKAFNTSLPNLQLVPAILHPSRPQLPGRGLGLRPEAARATPHGATESRVTLQHHSTGSPAHTPVHVSAPPCWHTRLRAGPGLRVPGALATLRSSAYPSP